jgi:hypothetical protein
MLYECYVFVILHSATPHANNPASFCLMLRVEGGFADSSLHPTHKYNIFGLQCFTGNQAQFTPALHILCLRVAFIQKISVIVNIS